MKTIELICSEMFFSSMLHHERLREVFSRVFFDFLTTSMRLLQSMTRAETRIAILAITAHHLNIYIAFLPCCEHVLAVLLVLRKRSKERKRVVAVILGCWFLL